MLELYPKIKQATSLLQNPKLYLYFSIDLSLHVISAKNIKQVSIRNSQKN